MKSIIEYINECTIVEMAISRSQYINLLYNLDEQILQNWCLVHYCNEKDRTNECSDHWKTELLSYLKRLTNKKLKITNKLKLIKSILIEKEEFDTYLQVYKVIHNKMLKENISDDNIEWMCKEVIKHIDDICVLINTSDEEELYKSLQYV